MKLGTFPPIFVHFRRFRRISLKELSETVVFELLQDPDETTNAALTNSTSLSDLTVDANDRTTTLTILSDETGIVTLTAPTSA